MKSLQPIVANRTNAILTIVDVQNRSCHPDGESWDEHKARVVPPALTVIRAVVEGARQVEIPIVYIQSVRTHQEPEVTVFGYKKRMKIGTWDVAIVDEIEPRPGDPSYRSTPTTRSARRISTRSSTTSCPTPTSATRSSSAVPTTCACTTP